MVRAFFVFLAAVIFCLAAVFGAARAAPVVRSSPLSFSNHASSTQVPVNVYACPFSNCDSSGLPNRSVWLVETNQTFITDDIGMIYLTAEVGDQLTFRFVGGDGYVTTQAGTVFVPPEGLATLESQVVLQVPSDFLYDFLWLVTPGKKRSDRCQVVVTVCDAHRTVASFPQGLPGVAVRMDPPLLSRIFYFGTWGNFSNETNPFPNHLNSTSWDGGVLIENVPVDVAAPYVVNASRAGYNFTSSTVWCVEPNLFINAAPNQGPRVIPATKVERVKGGLNRR